MPVPTRRDAAQAARRQRPRERGVREAAFVYRCAQFHSHAARALRDCQRRFRYENVLNIIVKQPAPALCHYRLVALYRARDERRFSQRDLQLMRSLRPHLLEALSANRMQALFARSTGEPKPRRWHAGIAEAHGGTSFLEPGLRDLLRLEWPRESLDRVPAALWACLFADRIYRGREIVATVRQEHGLLFLRVRPRCAADGLSPRELDVARLACAGATHKQIAAQLGIYAANARNQFQAIHEKMNVHNRAQMLAQLRLASA
jgi:DNA-binding CsgD family transcriptional regulator